MARPKMDEQKLWNIIVDFDSRKISAMDFESNFLKNFGGNDRHLSEEEFEILDWLFGKVDAFCIDPEILDPKFDIGENELRESVKKALNKKLKLDNDIKF